MNAVSHGLHASPVPGGNERASAGAPTAEPLPQNHTPASRQIPASLCACHRGARGCAGRAADGAGHDTARVVLRRHIAKFPLMTRARPNVPSAGRRCSGGHRPVGSSAARAHHVRSEGRCRRSRGDGCDGRGLDGFRLLLRRVGGSSGVATNVHVAHAGGDEAVIDEARSRHILPLESLAGEPAAAICGGQGHAHPDLQRVRSSRDRPHR
jgi:hypothetical protein